VDILDDMEVSKLSAKVFSKVNYSFKNLRQLQLFSANSLSICIESLSFILFNLLEISRIHKSI